MKKIIGWILIDSKGKPILNFGLPGHHIVFSELSTAMQNLKEFPNLKADGWKQVEIRQIKKRKK